VGPTRKRLRCSFALRCPGCGAVEAPTAVALVLTVHDTAHRGWLELLPRLDGPARAATEDLYAFCGRVACTLQRGPHPRLPAATSADVRALLAEHLTTLSCAAETAVLRRFAVVDPAHVAESSASVLALPTAG
jgi:hypothetical protein